MHCYLLSVPTFRVTFTPSGGIILATQSVSVVGSSTGHGWLDSRIQIDVAPGRHATYRLPDTIWPPITSPMLTIPVTWLRSQSTAASRDVFVFHCHNYCRSFGPKNKTVWSLYLQTTLVVRVQHSLACVCLCVRTIGVERPEINKLQTSEFTFKLNHNLLSPQFPSYFHLNSDIRCYHARSHQDYHM